MLGELLGARYQVIHILGSGGFGHTYIAEDTQRPGNPRCVLKHLTFSSPNPTVLQQVRRLFQVEAETLEKLGKHDQIPHLLACFEENQEFYLVQEFIEGHPLEDELAEGNRFSEHQVICLLEDVLGILEYVHAQGVIHRDIKPANLIRRLRDNKLVLIDFGAVKTIGNTIAESTKETNLSLPIYTSGYAASEQCLGRPQYSSDLYSLAMVAIQSLVGLRPAQLPQDFNTCEIIWRDQVQVSDGLAAFLDKMTRYQFHQRYRSATEALQALHQMISSSPTALPSVPDFGKATRPNQQTPIVTQAQAQLVTVAQSPRQVSLLRSWKVLTGGGAAIALVLTGALMSRGFLPLRLFNETVPSPVSSVPVGIADRISTGERLLNQWQSGSNKVNPNKQVGVERFTAGDYAQAIAALETARQRDRTDPETLIYLNNARIGTAKSYAIAVVVPLGDVSEPALEILRGVAQAQDEVNRAGGINGIPLKVVIANDDNQPDIARNIATVLANRPEILGVVGHSTSDASIAAAAVYQANQLVMISPLSSAVQLSNIGSYIFRTMPNDRSTARALSDYMLNRLKKRKVVVFFNSDSAYSKSLKNEFKDALFYNGVEVLAEADFSRPDFDAYDGINQAIASGAEVLMLAPDHRTSDRAIQLVQVNRRRLPILSGDSIYTSKLLKLAGNEAVGMVLAIPADLTQAPFRKEFTRLWGTPAPLGWRTALAYDAAQALVVATGREPLRSGIQRVLSQPSFAVTGAEGPVSFSASGDRKSMIHLMTVKAPTAKAPTGYDYQPLPHSRPE